MKKLENKVAIITGAGSGMGKAIAKLYAQEGCTVVAADINQARLDDLERETSVSGGKVYCLQIDVSIDSDINRMMDVTLEKYKTLDIVVNNAGIMDHFAPVGEVDDMIWEKVMNINLEAPMKIMRRAVKHFLTKSSGCIINIASIGGLQGGRAGAAYTASKHAVVGLTKNTGYMYAKSGIRCNAIAPGGVNTNIGDTIDNSKITPLIQERILAGMVLNPRMGRPEEIASCALFLATDDSSFINGAVITVDGGWTAY